MSDFEAVDDLDQATACARGDRHREADQNVTASRTVAITDPERFDVEGDPDKIDTEEGREVGDSSHEEISVVSVAEQCCEHHHGSCSNTADGEDHANDHGHDGEVRISAGLELYY